MWCVKRLCVVSICVCILLCVYVYVMFNVVCCVLRVCVVVPGETGVVTAGMRSSAVARTRPGTQLRGVVSHRTQTTPASIMSNHYCVDDE